MWGVNPMAEVILGSQSQISLPENVVNQLNLSEGERLELEVRDGSIILTPKSSTSSDETWLKDPAARESLARGLEDIREGRTVGPFNNTEEVIQSLES